ncbi:hypothetical protein E8E13_007270 [Curvularia kusanoi]|uniref:Uncharacterized protein n=1 Tax=Curvularia kusanoi TaxID=90978 RepID=A0A9P4TGY3_CURKU|nr:hypothetical protein E8E13_007270 [Curvularia kusanoi]
MLFNTLTELKAYANEHFPDDFSKLPAVKIESLQDSYGRKSIRFGDRVNVHIDDNGIVSYMASELEEIEPFSWVSNGNWNGISKRDALLRYYCFTKYEDADLVQTSIFIRDFKNACADLAKIIRAVEAVAGDPSRWNFTTEAQLHIQKLEGRIEDNESRLQQHEARMAKLEAVLKDRKIETSEDNGDCIKRFAAVRVENEELKAQNVMLAKANAELHKKLAG